MIQLEKAIIDEIKSNYQMALYFSKRLDYSVSERQLAEMVGMSCDSYMRSEMVSHITAANAYFILMHTDGGLSKKATEIMCGLEKNFRDLERVDAFKQYDEGELERPVIGNVLETKPDS